MGPALPPKPPSLLEVVEVETPEHVAFSYDVAGLGSRALALALDTLLALLGAAGIWLAVALLAPAGAPGWALALALLLGALFYFGYFLLFEWLWDGQTPGKRWMRLRVVADGGYALAPAAAAVRNLVRVLDMQPLGTYFVGAVAAGIHPRAKRLGDLAAGTLVVRERPAGPEPAPPPVSETAAAGRPRLSEAEFALLDGYVRRRDTLPEDVRVRIEARLAELVRARDPTAGPDGAAAGPWLFRVHARERARRQRRATDEPSSAPAAALAHRQEPRWRLLARYLARGGARGLRGLSPAELSEFAALYREAAADLARARTYGADPATRDRLERLVGAAHATLYRRRPAIRWDGVRAFLRVGFPASVRRLRWPIAAAAAALLLPAAVAYVRVVLDPETAVEWLDPSVLARAEDAPQRAAEGRGYVEIPSPFMPVVAAGVIANNVQVTVLAFALGITAGLGTLALLVLNGIHIGATLGIFQAMGGGAILWSFVAAHGPLELTAAAIAGGAGLWMGSGLVLPGERTRAQALRERGRDAVPLLAGTTLLLALAGLVEGFVSPGSWPAAAKAAFGLLLEAVVLAYLCVPAAAGAGARDGPRDDHDTGRSP